MSTWPGFVPKPYSIKPGYKRPLFRACANPIFNTREVSAQEAVYRILSLPMSRSVVFVDTNPKHEGILKDSTTLSQLENDDTNGFQKRA